MITVPRNVASNESGNNSSGQSSSPIEAKTSTNPSPSEAENITQTPIRVTNTDLPIVVEPPSAQAQTVPFAAFSFLLETTTATITVPRNVASNESGMNDGNFWDHKLGRGSDAAQIRLFARFSANEL